MALWLAPERIKDDAKVLVKVKELAAWLHKEWKSGKRCLSRCQAGANRSGLVMGAVLMIEGYTATEAINLIRSKRGPHALFNDHFVRYLESC